MGKIHYYFLFFFIPLFITTSEVVFGQTRNEIDSVLSIIKGETNKEILIDNYNNLANLYSYSDIDSAYFYANKALESSEKAGYKNGKAEAFYLLAFFNNRIGKHNEAIDNLENAIKIYTELGDSSYLVGCYNNLGVLYSYSTDQKTSLEYFIKAMNMAEQINETFALSEAYSNIGSNYEFLKEYVSALKYYNKALEVDLKTLNQHNIAFSYITLGGINLKLQRYESARDSLMKAKQFISVVDDNYRKTELYIYLSDYYIETDQLDSAIYNIKVAKEINSKEKYNTLDADILTLEGDLLFKQKKYSECLVFYDNAIEQFLNQNILDGLYEIYMSKSEALSELGKHEKAFETFKKAQKLNEDFKPQEIAKTLGEFENAERIKEETTKLRLEQEILNQKDRNEILVVRAKLHAAIFSIAFLLVIVALVIYFYVVNRKHNLILRENYYVIRDQKRQLEENFLELKTNEEKLTALNATKDKFFSIIAHDLKNPFNVLVGLSDIVINDPDVRHSEDFEEIMDGIFKTAKSGYNLLDNLLVWARSQTGGLEYKPEMVNLSEIVATNMAFFSESAKAKNIDVCSSVPSILEVYADYNMMSFIVRNLLNNAIKFSYPNGKIEIRTNKRNDFHVFTIQDFGTGMKTETMEKLFKIESTNPSTGTANETGTGLGLLICKEFVEKNSGEIWVESEKGIGSSFHFSIPVKKEDFS
ncbi:MAG TPA: tetratricopeptide repeat-containing sensor histidine kinase [Draconibacterium sp.]|jgi:signal transduction histidine kinase|nr:tetratricopeptide repeat-containing sensor histidine kinase [Draconibacterium sp.]